MASSLPTVNYRKRGISPSLNSSSSPSQPTIPISFPWFPSRANRSPDRSSTALPSSPTSASLPFCAPKIGQLSRRSHTTSFHVRWFSTRLKLPTRPSSPQPLLLTSTGSNCGRPGRRAMWSGGSLVGLRCSLSARRGQPTRQPRDASQLQAGLGMTCSARRDSVADHGSHPGLLAAHRQPHRDM